MPSFDFWLDAQNDVDKHNYWNKLLPEAVRIANAKKANATEQYYMFTFGPISYAALGIAVASMINEFFLNAAIATPAIIGFGILGGIVFALVLAGGVTYFSGRHRLRVARNPEKYEKPPREKPPANSHE